MMKSGSVASRFRAAYLLAGALVATPRVTSAQVVISDMAPCTYRMCALAIVPRWNGLAVVRRPAGWTVTNLNFFWPRDVSAALRGPPGLRSIGADSAVTEARRALHLRRIGAALTDGGVVLGVLAFVRATHDGRLQRPDGILAAAGAASLGLSIPFQFAADGALSRAVWWHNLRYARE